MCAIIGSFNKEVLYDLYKLNSYRGTYSHSLTEFTYKDEGPWTPASVKLHKMVNGKGELSKGLIDNASGEYFVAHSQAPTSEITNIHPAVYGDAMLWHNGIIKQKCIPEGSWDTAWLLENIINYGWSSLSRIDGTFACIMYNAGELFVFRNEISPLFVDNNLSFSSSKFEGGEPIQPNVVFRVDLYRKLMYDKVAFFDTFENPYYIPE